MGEILLSCRLCPCQILPTVEDEIRKPNAVAPRPHQCLNARKEKGRYLIGFLLLCEDNGIKIGLMSAITDFYKKVQCLRIVIKLCYIM